MHHGRPMDSINSISTEIGANKYFIAGNGAIIYDMQKQETIYEKYMSKEKVLEILKLCEENSISYNIYTETTILAKALKYNVLYYHKENLKKEENKRTNIKIVNNLEEYVKNSQGEKFVKITICDNNKHIFQSIIKKLRNINNIEVLDVLHMSRKIIKQGTEDIPIEYFYTEISLKNVNKWEALKVIAEKMNIERQEIIAIGDNINDKEMIENAGLGIVMQGSTPIVTKLADYITDTNNNEGVAKALEKWLIWDRS